MAIESPVQVLQRLREKARTERLQQAQSGIASVMGAKTGKDRARAFGNVLASAFIQGFQGESNKPEDSPEVAQAKQRSEWLGVAPDDINGIKSNIKAANDVGDYEAARYLTDMYYKARTLAQRDAEINAKGDKETGVDLKSGLGKEIQDAEKLRAAGYPDLANELERRIQEEQRQKEAEARGKQMETVDKALSNTFGLSLTDDLNDKDAGPHFQGMAESMYDRTEKNGEKMSAVRNDLKKYFSFNKGAMGNLFGTSKFSLSSLAEKELSEGKIGFGTGADGRLALYARDAKGNATRLISYVDQQFADRYNED